MEDAIIVVLLCLLFMVVVVLNFSTKLRSKIKVWQYMTFGMTIGFLVMYFSLRSEKKDWLQLNFGGEVINRVITDNHALVEFAIKQENGVVVVLDKYWKMDDCEIGDHVLKQSGEMHVYKTHKPTNSLEGDR